MRYLSIPGPEGNACGPWRIVEETSDAFGRVSHTVVAHAVSEDQAETLVDLLNLGLDAPVPSLHECSINVPAIADTRVLEQHYCLN